MFGAHRNIHSGPAEHNHIELSKQPAVRTQIRAHVFDWQVANRLVDKLVVNLADFTMQEHISSPSAVVTSESPIIQITMPQVTFSTKLCRLPT